MQHTTPNHPPHFNQQMVMMALITTIMTSPIVEYIYPPEMRHAASMDALRVRKGRKCVDAWATHKSPSPSPTPIPTKTATTDRRPARWRRQGARCSRGGGDDDAR